MADKTYEYSAEYAGEATEQVTQVAAAMEQLNENVQTTNEQMAVLAEIMGTVHEAVTAVSTTDIDPKKAVTSFKKLEQLSAKLKKNVKDDNKELKAAIVQLDKIIGKEKERLNITKKHLGLAGKIGLGLDKAKKAQGEVNKTFGGITQKFGGFSLTLGGILSLLLDVYNLGRKIHGLAMMGAGTLGGTPRAISQVKNAMGDLRRNFAMSYEDAGALVQAFTKMGYTAEDLAGKRFVPRNFVAPAQLSAKAFEDMHKSAALVGRDVMSAVRPTEAIKKGVEVAAHYSGEIRKNEEKLLKLKKQHAAAEATREKGFKREYGTVETLHALQVKYNIAIGQSSKFVFDMQREFGKTEKEGVGLVGTAAMLKEELSEAGVEIGAEEILADWSQMIDKVKIFKTDLMGVLSLYNTLARSEFADTIGLGDTPLSVRKELGKSLVSSAVDMDIGMQAFLGKGASPAARALEFRETAANNPLEVLERIADRTQKMVMQGADPATAALKSEIWLKQIFKDMSSETAIALGKKFATGDITSASVQNMMAEQATRQKQLGESRDKFEKNKGALIDYAKNASLAVQSIEELIKKWLHDTLLPLLRSMRGMLTKIHQAILSNKDIYKFDKEGMEEKHQQKRMRDAYGIDSAASLTGARSLKMLTGDKFGGRYSGLVKEFQDQTMGRFITDKAKGEQTRRYAAAKVAQVMISARDKMGTKDVRRMEYYMSHGMLEKAFGLADKYTDAVKVRNRVDNTKGALPPGSPARDLTRKDAPVGMGQMKFR